MEREWGFSGREEWKLGRERVRMWVKWEERGGRGKKEDNNNSSKIIYKKKIKKK